LSIFSLLKKMLQQTFDDLSGEMYGCSLALRVREHIRRLGTPYVDAIVLDELSDESDAVDHRARAGLDGHRASTLLALAGSAYTMQGRKPDA
jgi:hypothetical protein